jgi:AcrR family transcriptional regulator
MRSALCHPGLVLSSTIAILMDTSVMPFAPSAPAADASADHRRRLLDAMSEVVARKGYADTTIADIAAQARVSKRTFYEHFAGKAECLFALYTCASEQALQVLQQALDPAKDWHEQVEAAVGAYFGTLSSNAPLLRTLFIEILHLGPEGLRVRRRVSQNIADFIVRVVGERAHGDTPLLPMMAMAIVGGINELVLQAIEQDRVDTLPQLTPAAAHLVRAVIDGTVPPEACARRAGTSASANDAATSVSRAARSART